MTVSLRKSPVVLLILDGFGIRTDAPDNAITRANMPFWQFLTKHYAFGTIEASERSVGLPCGQFGNSEVGHLNIGAGRVVEQDITRIDSSLEQNTLKNHPLLQNIDQSHTFHLMGLFSAGGVHSHIEHCFALLDILREKGIQKIVVHPILDGRDTPPRSALDDLQRLDRYCADYQQVKIGIVIGRFYAMDRDNRWERIEEAYNALVGVRTPYQANNAAEALRTAYQRNESDEFVQATRVNEDTQIRNGDSFLFFNFRADRARELTAALTLDDFHGFNRTVQPQLTQYLSMTDYGAQFDHPVLFEPQVLNNGLGETLSRYGIRQLRIAETEKYPHVTYFLNGGRENPYEGEERILVASPKVKTYDLMPQMSADTVTDHIVHALDEERVEVIICNFANGDMVGHTGHLSAAISAVETLDRCLERIVSSVQKRGGELLITADHGNCEQMFDEINQQAHTQHTTNPVPFVYVGEQASIRAGGALKDIAPTLLALLGIDQPDEMTGENLVVWAS